jgi:hypothetical protein
MWLVDQAMFMQSLHLSMIEMLMLAGVFMMQRLAGC